MFFKNDDKIDRRAVNIAYFATFIFWSVALLINSAFEFYNKEFISSSFMILLMGLAVFFLTEFIASKIRGSQAHK
ncbi:hypothetical protein P9443_01370 [Peribacillus frigoritolerans]|uniref:hypothetical protein n=1 Tax=Peribacillus frigoritolerans TaxID=450367 RepID=UPI002E1B88F3|nr:hypothetical protein [Peribacillus frigoritolerans]